MAIIWMDGFEVDFPDKSIGLWDSYTESASGNGNLYYTSSNARTGDGCLQVHSTSSLAWRHLSKTLADTYTELYIGFGLFFASTTPLDADSSQTVPLLCLLSSSGDRQITFGIDKTTNVLNVYRGGNNGTLLGSGITGLAANTIHYIELHVIISNTVGVVQIRLNGNLEIDLSAQDTSYTPSSDDIKVVQLGILNNGSTPTSGASIDAYFDDFIINDTSGSVANDWPNGAGILRLDPNADGNYSQWTPNNGGASYVEVDELSTYGNLPDGDTSYISDMTVTDRTSVALDDTGINGTVLGVMLATYSKNSASGSDAMAQFLRIGGVDYDEADYVSATDYGWHTDIDSISPATGVAFTTSEIDAMELGWKVS